MNGEIYSSMLRDLQPLSEDIKSMGVTREQIIKRIEVAEKLFNFKILTLARYCDYLESEILKNQETLKTLNEALNDLITATRQSDNIHPKD